MGSPKTSALRDFLWETSRLDPDQPATLRRAGAYLLMVVVVLILGFNWPILAIGLRDVSPVWMTALRVCSGAVTVVAVAAVTGRLRLPPRGDLPVVLSVAILRLGLVFFLVFTALTIVPAGRSSVLVWTASLWVVPMAVIALGERMTRLRWAGLALGIAGVVVLIEPWRLAWDEPRVILGIGMLLLSAILNAATAVHIRHHAWVSTPLRVMPWQLLIAMVLTLTVAFAVEGTPQIHWTSSLVGVIVYEGVLATGLALWAQVSVLRSLPAVSTNLSMMMVPVVGVLASALLLGEVITATVVAAMALIFIGVSLNIGADRSIAES